MIEVKAIQYVQGSRRIPGKHCPEGAPDTGENTMFRSTTLL
jgi:hypothetical protein